MKRGLTYFTWLKQTRPAMALWVAALLLPITLMAIDFFAPAFRARWIPSQLNYLAALVFGATLIVTTVAWYAFSQWRQERANVQRLQDLQGQYGLAEDLALLGSWIYHVSENRYDWSDGSFTVFGIDMENGVPSSKGFLICIHPEDQDRWKAAHKKAIRKGQDVRIEYRYIKHGKEVVWVRSVARCEKDSQGRVVRLAGIVQDTSAIRAMAAQLSRSEAKFRDLSQISSDWFWETDTEHKLSFISESAISELGSWIRVSVGHARWDLTDSSLPGVDWKVFRQTMDEHKPFNEFVYTRIDPDGNLIYLSIGGRPLFDDHGKFQGYRGVGRNVTREREQQLLLEIESNIATIMREQSEPEKVVAISIATVCKLMGWIGGAHLRSIPGTNAIGIGEHWGGQAFTEMLRNLPSAIPLSEGSIEQKSWDAGKAVWVADLSQHSEFAERYQANALALKTAFIAPIVDENSQVMSALLMFGQVHYKADRFIAQVAETLSRNLSLYLQRKAAEKRLTRASLHDALTGLPNRVYLTHQLEAKLKRKEPVAVLYVDLDRFKIINDTLGHQVGDQVLIEVSRRAVEALRTTDVVGRIGGDEFIMLLDQLDDPDEIEMLARRVLTALEKPFIFGGRAYFLSGSIGVAIAPRDGGDSKLLIKCADSAMYQVKSEGRNDVRFFSAELSDDRTEQLQLAAEMPSAMERGDVSLHYQPILNIDNRTLAGMEALIRWQHPKRGLLLPDRFLPIAEQSNLIREIGIWSIRRAIDDRTKMGITRFIDAPVSVNISAKQLSEEGFLDLIRNTLSEKNFPPNLLRLELSESSFIQDPQRTQGLISGLRGLGVSVIIDNFGTGYASLSYIKSLPVDGIKIDQVFIRNMAEDRGNMAIVQAIETLAKQMGMKAMAEGVETAEELRALRQANCTVVQGTFISPPLPVERLAEFVESLPVMRAFHLVQDNAA
jgi:diguanylate cyclase (GGDEF)-like protein